MKQKNQEIRRFQFRWKILLLLCFVFLLLVIPPILDDAIYYAGSAPIVTPEHSAQELWNTPLPTPEWITELPTSSGKNFATDKSLCVSLHLYPLWDWQIEDNERILRNSTGITVDGINVSRSDIEFLHVGYAQLNCENCEVDEPNYICFDSPAIEPGLHTATIRIESITRAVYSHEWAFQVNNAN